MFSRFFIDRPVFSAVVSLLIVLVGAVSMIGLPIDRYPEIVPPTIQITANYPGADAQTVAESVVTPIEEQLSGIPGLLYFSSTSANNGAGNVIATFEIGTNQDLAAVEVQNRLSRAQPRLPQEVVRQGLTVTKASSNILAVVNFQSDDPRHDDVFLSNFATINLLDAIRRTPGVGDAIVFGVRDYSMRVWVDPDHLAVRNMTVSDVAAAVREQNAVFPSGTLAQRPQPTGASTPVTMPVITSGRLSDVESYDSIILRANPDGSVVRLKDVARTELGSQSYDLFGRVNGNAAGLMLLYLQTGANALDAMDSVRATLKELEPTFPPGVRVQIPFDTTNFVRVSVDEVVHTLVIAVLLVLAVVFVFLQSWRATLIPLLAVPVSIIGTFAGMEALGFSINTLTLFGLVLAIGIVVDDAIVVVENVERVMEEEGLPPREATIKAMKQVSGPIIAIVLVLSAVFVPVAFLGGMTGQIYRQFAITIAVSVIISGFVALSLSPALCVLLLKPTHGKKKFFLFRWFNGVFGWITRGYTASARAAIRFGAVTTVIFGALGFMAWQLSQRIPSGFLPGEDQGYVICVAILPDGASLDRTNVVLKQVETFFKAQPAVENVTVLGGFDVLNGRTNATNAAVAFVTLRPFADRRTPELSADALVAAANRNFFGPGGPHDGMAVTLSPPPIQGLGIQAGFEMQIQAKAGQSIEELAKVGDDFLAAARADGRLANLNGSLRMTVPRLFVDLDRTKTKILGVKVGEVFETLQAYFGSLYVNDFNKFGRVWRVQLQAEARFRDQPDDIDRIFVRNSRDGMVPLSGVVKPVYKAGPNAISHFSGFPAIQVTGAPVAPLSSGQGLDAVREIGAKTLPTGFGFEWSGASYQEVKAGNQAPVVLLFGLVVVFLVLAAQYERWSLPVAVLLAVPIGVLGALAAIWLRGLSQDIYFQIGLLTLVGLSAKNAVLIVEFCVEQRRAGKGLVESAVEAAQIRFRPIVMTSLAFILGVLPLAIATGAGASARHSIGTGVIGGMLAATFLAILFVPFFFVVMQWMGEQFGRVMGRPARIANPEAANLIHGAP